MEKDKSLRTEANTIRIHKIEPDSLVDGEGLRIAIFTAGCSHGCVGCHNPELQQPENCVEMSTDRFAIDLLDVTDEFIDGFTVTGGDPLYDVNNCHRILNVISGIKEDHQDVWLYTGYDIEVIPFLILKLVDVVVDGKYEQDRSEGLYRGSDNQCIWKKVMEEDDTVRYKNTSRSGEFFTKNRKPKTDSI